jgi:hypothetical protein
MTIRFLQAWDGHQSGDIATLATELEESLTTSGLAAAYTAPVALTNFVDDAPAAPGAGTFTLKCVDGVLAWVEDAP